MSTEKIVFLTGGATGIGAQIARQLAGEGHAIALAIRNPERAEALCAELVALGGRAIAIACDVRDASQVTEAIARTQTTFGRIDVVINNAGQINPIGPFETADIADWRNAIDTNLVAPFIVAQAATPALRNSQGVLINISTGASTVPRKAWSAYCSAKAGLAMYTRCAALELEPDGILVVGVQPGMVDTAMQERIRDSGANEVSLIPREDLLSPSAPASAISWLLRSRPADLNGRDLSLADLRTLAGAEADW